MYVRAGRPQRIAFGQLASDQLKKCGIGLTVKEGDFATVLLPLLSYPNDFDTYLGGWTTSIDPDDYSIFHSSKCTTKENPDDNNFVCWNNPEGDKLLEDGRQELDQAKRKEIYAKFQQIAHDDLPYYFTWSDLANAASRSPSRRRRAASTSPARSTTGTTTAGSSRPSDRGATRVALNDNGRRRPHGRRRPRPIRGRTTG